MNEKDNQPKIDNQQIKSFLSADQQRSQDNSDHQNHQQNHENKDEQHHQEERKQQKQGNQDEKQGLQDDNGSLDVQQSQQRHSEIDSRSPLQVVYALNSQNIVFHAFMERIGMIHNQFNQFISKQQPQFRSHETVLQNIVVEIQRKIKYKMVPSYILREYFQQVMNHEKQMSDQCSKIKNKDKDKPSIININELLKVGFEELLNMRRQIGDECLSYIQFLKEHIIKKINKVFGEYEKKMNEAMDKVKAINKIYSERVGKHKKRVSKIDKVYGKAKQGISQDEDLFEEMIKFMESQQLMEESLKELGAVIMDSRRTLISEEQLLFQQVQRILNDYKSYTKTTKYGSKNNNVFEKIIRVNEVAEDNGLQKLCMLTDIDYIRFVMEVGEKGELRDKTFQNFFNLQYLKSDIVAGLLKATIIKSFILQRPKEQLIETISGSIIHFNILKSECKDRMLIKNIKSEIIGKGMVQVSEKKKGILFDSNRKLTFIFKDSDTAEQFFIMLNKQNNEPSNDNQE